MRTFLFLALRDPALTARLIQGGARTGATIILDLEDALWDVADPEHTATLKATGRATLIALTREHGDLFRRHAIGVRINAIHGPEVAADLDAIADAAEHAPISVVVVPKVESDDDLPTTVDGLRRRGMAGQELVPILESRRAIASLDDVLAAAAAAGAEWVIYGLYDLSLDAGWWPIPSHDTSSFWDSASPFIERVEAAGLHYVHPPFLRTRDEAGLRTVLERTRGVCRRDFGLLAVSLAQAAATERFNAGRPPPAPAGRAFTGAARDLDPRTVAEHVVAAYGANHRPDAAFALDPRTGEFIPPHAYLAARRYLDDRRHG
jgi:citrate lyase beta subunit